MAQKKQQKTTQSFSPCGYRSWECYSSEQRAAEPTLRRFGVIIPSTQTSQNSSEQQPLPAHSSPFSAPLLSLPSSSLCLWSWQNQPNPAQFSLVTHKPVPPGVPETQRMGTALKCLCSQYRAALPRVPPLPLCPHLPNPSQEGLCFIPEGATSDANPEFIMDIPNCISCLGSQELRKVESSCLVLVAAMGPGKTTWFGSSSPGRIHPQFLKSFAQKTFCRALVCSCSITVSLQPSCCSSTSIPCLHSRPYSSCSGVVGKEIHPHRTKCSSWKGAGPQSVPTRGTAQICPQV